MRNRVKAIIGLAILICVASPIVFYWTLHRPQKNTRGHGHPFPLTDEVYEARCPDTQQPVVRVVTTTWTDGHRAPFVLMFRPADSTPWYIYIDKYHREQPLFWPVFRARLRREARVPFAKILSVPASGPNIYHLPSDWAYDWATIDKALELVSGKE